MDKEQFKTDLWKLRNWILSFQEEKKMEIINVPSEKIKIDEKYYEKHDLENNSKLKSALFGLEYRNVSDKIKKEVYDYKSWLKQEYWKLEKFIKKFWLNPSINNFNCYDAFFLNDNRNWESNNYKSIISDIDIILWKLDSLSKKEFNDIINPKNNNYWKILNPIYCFLELLKLWWKHKIISSIIIFFIWIIITIIITDSIKPLTDIITKPISDTLSWSLNK